jgi:periplasmic divalent cation tolerance protein
MYLAWTTTANRADAERIATDVVARQLAACVQIEGPIVSIYRWQGKIERGEEYRLCFKCVAADLPALEQRVLAIHPYDTPEWVAVAAAHVGEKYLSWARATSSSPPL